MPLTPVACPNCGNILQANTLETVGAVGTPCRECGETVFIETDEDGRVQGIFTSLEGGAHGAQHFEAGNDGRVRKVRSVVPLLMGLLALLLLLWTLNSVFCRRVTPAPRLQDEIVIPKSPTPEPTPTPLVLNRETGVTFDTGKATLTPQSRARLEEVAARMLRAPRDRFFEIAGHTDDTGNEPANIRLSMARAEAVRAFMRARGVAADMMTVRGYGSQFPKGDNLTPDGREQNRRIEIVPLARTSRDLAP
jgi:outer membrane protein OmpA-like peptidoglycan-associated protein